MGRKAEPTERPRILVEMEYDEAAKAYLRSLNREFITETQDQGTQRAITLESFAVLKASRDDVHVLNETLIQWPHPNPRNRRKRQAVPDNMIAIWKGVLRYGRSFNVPLQPCGPFWVMEYLSTTNQRKDYSAAFSRYEAELKVPYYLLYVLQDEELLLYRHNGSDYEGVPLSGCKSITSLTLR